MSLATPAYYTSFFFFNDTATTEIYTLSLHDALPIYEPALDQDQDRQINRPAARERWRRAARTRSEEHTSELQSHLNLVCRLLLEKKKEMPHEPQKIRPLDKDRIDTGPLELWTNQLRL